MKKKKVKYIITEEFKTNKLNSMEEDLIKIFNLKIFNYIMRKERNNFKI